MQKLREDPKFQAQMEENRAQQKKLDDLYTAAISKVLYPRQRTSLKKMLGPQFDRSKLGGPWAGPGNGANQAAAKGNGANQVAAKKGSTTSSDDDEEETTPAAKPASKTPTKAKRAPTTSAKKSLRELRGSASSSDQ
jgi:hypothetical protein